MYFSSSLRYIRASIALVLLGVLLLPGTLFAGTFTHNWSATFGTTTEENVEDVHVNNNGVYLIGDFRGTVDFDPSSGTDNHSAQSGADVFVSHYTTSGAYQWTKTLAGTGSSDFASQIKSDTDGNIYISGWFNGTSDFDPGAGTSFATTTGNTDAYLLKLDQNGDFEWVKTFGSTGADVAETLTVYSGNVYLGGDFAGTVNFNPDGTDNHTSTGNSDVYIATWQTDGTYDQTITYGGTAADKLRNLHADADGLFAFGDYNGTADFDPTGGTTTRTSNGGFDLYLARYELAGTLDWVKAMGSTGSDIGSNASNAIHKDDDNLYITGFFQNTVNFNPDGDDEFTGSGTLNYFISSWTTDGDYRWTAAGGTTGSNNGHGIASYDSGIFHFGKFSGTHDFDLGSATDEKTSAGSTDIFVTRYSEDGAYGWTDTLGGTGLDEVEGIAASANTFYLAGWFQGTTDFDITSETDSHTSAGDDDAFLTTFTYTNTPPTTITLSTTDIDENTPSGTTIATLGTSDTDESDTHTYTLVSGSGSEDNSLFTISGSDLNLAFTPDYEDPQSADGDNVYSIRIQVTDGEETYTTTFEIEVYDIKDTNRSSGSSTTYVCTDPNASNYDIGGKHRQSECEYDTDTTSPTPTTPTTDSSVTALILQNKSIFQTAHDLGITLPAFILNLLGLTPGTPTLPTRDLQVGDEGQDVYNLQVFLNTHGYTLATDGPGAPHQETTRFGALTQAALARFQEEHQISPAVGYYGPVTRGYIEANY